MEMGQDHSCLIMFSRSVADSWTHYYIKKKKKEVRLNNRQMEQDVISDHWNFCLTTQNWEKICIFTTVRT